MRSHHKPPPPLPDAPWHPPDEIPLELQHWLIYDATWSTSWSLADYARCQTCGHAIGFAECTATATLPDGKPATCCWSCLVGILVHRGSLDPDSSDWPQLHGAGDSTLRFPALGPVVGQQRG